MRVLIVDDSRIMRQIIRRSLSKAGFHELEITEAANGIEALDDLLGGNDVTQQRLESLNFSSKKFNLVSLDGIEFIGVADVSLRHDIHT